MFRRVCGQVLPDIAQVSDFLQITVHALIAYDRQAEAFFPAYGMFLVFFEDGKRNLDRKSTRLNSSHVKISYAVFCLKKKKKTKKKNTTKEYLQTTRN
mgnify:CR=1 FL=1